MKSKITTGCVGASHGQLGCKKRGGWAEDNRTDSQGESTMNNAGLAGDGGVGVAS